MNKNVIFYNDCVGINKPDRYFHALSYNWAQSNGAGNIVTDLGDTGNLFDFKNIDTTGLSDYSANSVIASDVVGEGYSFEVWLRAHLTGSGTSVSNIKFWESTPFAPATGITTKIGFTSTYATPVNTTSSVATSAIPTSTPGTPNVPIGGDVNATLSSFPAFSDYIVLQVHVGSTAGQGDSSLATYSLAYDET